MKRTAYTLFLILIVVLAFSASIGAVYVYVLPKFYPGTGWGTYSPLNGGIIIAMLIGGYIGYRAPKSDELSVKVGSGLCYGLAVAMLVSYFSLLIIMNIRGS